MKKCPHCNARLEDNARFCHYCMSLLEPKRAVGGIKANKKGWQIPTAALLVLAIVVGVVFAANGGKGPAAPTGSDFSQNETSSFSESGGNYADEHSSSQTPSDQDNSQSTTSKTVNIVRPSSSSSDNSTSSLPSWRDEHVWPLSSSSSETFTSTSSKKSTSTSSKKPTSTSSKKSTSTSSNTPTSSKASSEEVLETYIEGDYAYCISNSKAIIKDANNSLSGDVVIPDTLGGYPVTGLDTYSFDSCNLITTIKFPDTLTEIGHHAFQYCSNLTSITIPEGVTRIEGCTFDNCKALTSVKLPNNLVYIGGNAFTTCDSLKTLTLPNSLTTIGWRAFFSSGLERIVIPDSVTSIEDEIFDFCSKLKSVTFGGGVKSIDYWFEYCENLETVKFKEGVEQVAVGVFSDCAKLKKVYLPKSMTKISDKAFDGCAFITDIYYAGTSAQKSKISIGLKNDAFVYSATWHYNYDY